MVNNYRLKKNKKAYNPKAKASFGLVFSEE